MNAESFRELLETTTNLPETIRTIKKLLIESGYDDHSDEDRLFFTRVTGKRVETIDINLTRYRRDQQTTLPKIETPPPAPKKMRATDEESDDDTQVMKETSNEHKQTIEEPIYLQGWFNMFDWSGRATRSEFWAFGIVNVMFAIVIALTQIEALMGFFMIASILAHLSLDVRRIRDTGLSAHWGWILIPLMLPMTIIAFVPTDRFKKVKKSVQTHSVNFKSNQTDTATKLEQYHKLLLRNAITQDEYDALKKKLLERE